MHTRRIANASVINVPLRKQGAYLSLTLDLHSWCIVGAGLLCATLLTGAVIAANLSAAISWNIRDSRAQLVTLSDARSELVAKISTLDDRETLQRLAEQSGMTAARSVQYLVEEGPHTAAR